MPCNEELPGINWPSVASLCLRFRFVDTDLGDATGFVVVRGGTEYLITNRHCVRGRANDTNAPLSGTGGYPDRVAIAHHAAGHPAGSWLTHVERLYDERGPLWLEHPDFGPRVDVVALPLAHRADVALNPYDPWEPAPRMSLIPSTHVSIIGFPYGQTAGALFPIWVSGAIASEMAVDWDGLPTFLVDARTRSGSSGSPVIAYREVPQVGEEPDTIKIVLVHRLLGVYSGRIADPDGRSDLGIVWKTNVIRDLIDGQKRGVPSVGDPAPD